MNNSNPNLKPIDSFFLPRYTVIKDRWEIAIKIGQGAFGQTYTAYDKIMKDEVAIKVEPLANKKHVLKVEVSLLRKLQEDCPNVPKYVGCGKQDDFNFMVMELLGKNISELRRKRVDSIFSLSTTAILAKQMLRAIKAIHDHGYLHRDVKPSNFVIGLKKFEDPELGSRHRCYIIDFGLSRRHMGKENEVREARDVAGFRGTARYAAIAAHKNMELGRKDDLWSLFYIMVEFLAGGLPWRKEKDKDKIGEMKEAVGYSLVETLHPALTDWMKHLDSLTYGDRPDYEMLNTKIDNMLFDSGDTMDVLYDWERSNTDFSGASVVSNQTSSNFRRLGTSNPAVIMTTTTPMKSAAQEESTSPEISDDKQRKGTISDDKSKKTTKDVVIVPSSQSHKSDGRSQQSFFQKIVSRFSRHSKSDDSERNGKVPQHVDNMNSGKNKTVSDNASKEKSKDSIALAANSLR